MKITAPAKINLALHCTGQRADGYHLLDMLVVFTDCGDALEFKPANQYALRFKGRFGDALGGDAAVISRYASIALGNRHCEEGRSPDEAIHSFIMDCRASPTAALAMTVVPENLITKAYFLLKRKAEQDGINCPDFEITLTKDLPVSSGIGGGSSDAGATLKALHKLWNLPYGDEEMRRLALTLGADVPMCYLGVSAIVTGVGEDIVPMKFPLQNTAILCVNPLQAVSTPAVFKGLKNKNNPPLSPLTQDILTDKQKFLDYLAGCRNDLLAPALTVCPEIQTILDALNVTRPLIPAKLSGSGATCFALYENKRDAEIARKTLPQNWWSLVSQLS